MDEDLRLFQCACGDAALSVHHDLEDKEDWPYICVSFWRWGHRGSACDRLRHVWYIIRFGHPYEDEVLLTPEAALDLAAHLRRLVEAGESAETGEQA